MAKAPQVEQFVVGSPTTTATAWDAPNADDKVPVLYSQIADETDVEILRGLRSHSWRATLHGVYADVMDALSRAGAGTRTEPRGDARSSARAPTRPTSSDPDLQRLLDALDEGESGMAAFARAGLAPDAGLAALAALELAGMVRRQPGGRFVVS